MDRSEDAGGRLDGRAASSDRPGRAAPIYPKAGRLAEPADSYLTPEGLIDASRALAQHHGGREEAIGHSHEGRPILAFRFGPDRPGGILLISLVHASEWIGGLASLRTAEQLTEEDADLSLTLVPVANPDGASRVQREVARRRLTFRRGNARGVDLNRNFPPTHRASGFWSAFPMYRPGPHAASEPETRAIVDIAARARPACAISFHSFGRWIFHPPASARRADDRAARHAATLERAGGAASAGYRSRQLGRWAFWFRAHGSEIDHFSAEGSCLAYLVEVSRGGVGRWPPPLCFLPFFAYNPPRPEAEIERVSALCARIARAAITPGARRASGPATDSSRH